MSGTDLSGAYTRIELGDGGNMVKILLYFALFAVVSSCFANNDTLNSSESQSPSVVRDEQDRGGSSEVMPEDDKELVIAGKYSTAVKHLIPIDSTFLISLESTIFDGSLAKMEFDNFSQDVVEDFLNVSRKQVEIPPRFDVYANLIKVRVPSTEDLDLWSLHSEYPKAEGLILLSDVGLSAD
ncbi:MAG TPA: hypothetical protein VMM38_10595 [Aridibacter sp.]|nr:hypothetical protein [Aridibacter sp.]